MTALDAARAVLGWASLIDSHIPRPDPGVAAAWADLLGDIDPDDALAAAKAHYGAVGAERIMPADVVAGVKRIRAARIADADPNWTPDCDPDNVVEYNRAVREHIARVADGTERARPVGELLRGTLKALPQ